MSDSHSAGQFKLSQSEFDKLVAACGFLDGISFRGVDDYLKTKVLRLLLQERFDANQRKFELLYKKGKR